MKGGKPHFPIIKNMGVAVILMSLGNAISLFLIIFIFAFVMYKINSMTKKPKPEKTQDLFQFKEITEDGYIEMPDGTYRAMIEVEPINMYLRVPEEQKAVWLQFRSMLNSLHVPISLMIQSRHKEIRSYTTSLREMSAQMPTEPLRSFGFELANYLESEVSEEHIKDRRYYIVVDVNPYVIDSDIEIPSEMISNFVRSFQKKISPKEARDLAKQEINDTISVIATYLKGMGLNIYLMDKNAILEMTYSSLNRDLAPALSYRDIVYSTNIHANSLTKEAIEEDMGTDYFEKISNKDQLEGSTTLN